VCTRVWRGAGLTSSQDGGWGLYARARSIPHHGGFVCFGVGTHLEKTKSGTTPYPNGAIERFYAPINLLQDSVRVQCAPVHESTRRWFSKALEDRLHTVPDMSPTSSPHTALDAHRLFQFFILLLSVSRNITALTLESITVHCKSQVS
jgi:hypothetical protein